MVIRLSTSLFSFFLFCSVFGAQAATRPSVEEWKKKGHVLGDQLATDFFKNRRTKTECRERLRERRIKYYEARHKLDQLVKQEASKEEILTANEIVQQTRESYFAISDLGKEKDPQTGEMVEIETCGDVSAPGVEAIKVDNGGLVPELWFLSHGYGSAAHLSPEALEKAHDDATTFIRTPNAQEHHAVPAGFPKVLRFVVVRDSDKLPQPKFGTVADNTFHAFLAIRADFPPILPISGFIAFLYYIKNTITETTSQYGKMFDLVFKNADKGLLKPPRVFDVTVTGEEEETPHQWYLKDIIGWWYLNTETGLLRYSTAARFPFEKKELREIARYTHFETISEVVDRFYTPHVDDNHFLPYVDGSHMSVTDMAATAAEGK